MSDKKFDLLVFIGRFRPFHNGHKHVIDTALQNAHNVLVLVGSANRPRTAKNPWVYEEVRAMIHATYMGIGALSIAPLDDWMHDNDFRWLMATHRAVQNEIDRIQQWTGRETPLRVGLVGFSKDNTSYYLKKFPQWGSFKVSGVKDDGKLIDATAIRKPIIAAADGGCNPMRSQINELLQQLPVEVSEWLRKWVSVPANIQTMRDLKQAVDFAVDYKQEHAYKGKRDPETGEYKGKPYEAIHTTADSVIIQSGHVLLGKRKFNPGKDLWALPGGFAHAHEFIADSSLRETKEETRIRLLLEVLKLAFRFKHVFGDPNRSDDRGRIITHAYLYLLNDREELPFVEADDDFSEVRWWPLGLLDPRAMYSDHFWIIHKMIDMIPVD